VKIVVSGSRHLGKCLCPWRESRPCGVALQHRFHVDSVLRPHVHAAAARGEEIDLWHGAAEGADALAAEYWGVYQAGPVHPLPARWNDLGRRAGHVRNGLLIAQMPDLLIAFPWEGGSPGTWDAVEQARTAGIPESVHPVHSLCPLLLERIRR
jgi:hypothetical protein